MFIRLIGMMCAVVAASCQESQLTALVKDTVGNPMMDGKLLVKSLAGKIKTFNLMIKDGGATERIPFGTYVVECCDGSAQAHSRYYRLVYAFASRTDVIIRLTGLEAFQVNGEGVFEAWMLEGNVVTQAESGTYVRACHLAEAFCSDGAIAVNGRFSIPVAKLGEYVVWHLDSNKILSSGIASVSRLQTKRVPVKLIVVK